MKAKKQWLLFAAAGMLGLAACRHDAMTMCEEAIEAYCAWQAKCRGVNEARCVEENKRRNCNETHMKKEDERCNKLGGKWEHRKGSCAAESSKNCNKPCTIGGLDCMVTISR